MEFVFDKFTHLQIGWFCFKIKIEKLVKNPLLKQINIDNAVKCVLLPNIDNNNKFCHTAITNNLMTLNKNSAFKIHNNLDINIGCINFIWLNEITNELVQFTFII